MSATPPSIAIAALVLGGPESVRVVCFTVKSLDLTFTAAAYKPRETRAQYAYSLASRKHDPFSFYSLLHAGAFDMVVPTAENAMKSPRVQTAVCISGSERSFPELAHNFVEWLADVLVQLQSGVAFFGVRPLNEQWRILKSVLSFQAIATQQLCLPNQTKLDDFVLCSNEGRTNCQFFAVQQLCDLAKCETLIRNAERDRARPFDYVLRLRPDMAWELRLSLPPQTELSEIATIHVPMIESGSRSLSHSVNDKVAIGPRAAMGLYLTRVRHVERIAADLRISHQPTKQITTEEFLDRSLKLDQLHAKALPRWLYCHLTRRNLMKGAASKEDGCIRRWKSRRACSSLICWTVNAHYNCKCPAAEPCANKTQYPIFCVNTNGDQLHRGCEWPTENGTMLYQLAGMPFHGSRRRYAPTCNASSSKRSQLDRAMDAYTAVDVYIVEGSARNTSTITM